MIPLYALWLAGLTGMKWAVGRRAARVERKYVKAAYAAEAVSRKLQAKPGNNKPDAFAQAKSQYELGRLVETRDALEAKYLAWQGRREAVGRKLTNARQWKGRLVPYAVGVIDTGLVLAALHALGLPHGLSQDVVQDWAQSIVW